MEKEQKRRLIEILEECDKGYMSDSADRKFRGNAKYAKCFHDLEAGGFIVFAGGFGYFTSLAGREHLERLRGSLKVWVKDRSTIIVASIAVFFALASFVVGLVGLLLE